MKVWVPTYRNCDDGCLSCQDFGFSSKEAAEEYQRKEKEECIRRRPSIVNAWGFDREFLIQEIEIR